MQVFKILYTAIVTCWISCKGDDIGLIGYFVDGCPDGWESYTSLAGRFAVGVGTYSGTREDGTSESQTFSAGNSGGELQHKLTTAQMPSHNHNNGNYQYMLSIDCYGTIDGSTDNSCSEPNIYNGGAIQSAGSDGSHNNLPPYYALYPCKKIYNQYNYTLYTQFIDLQETVYELEEKLNSLLPTTTNNPNNVNESKWEIGLYSSTEEDKFIFNFSTQTYSNFNISSTDIVDVDEDENDDKNNSNTLSSFEIVMLVLVCICLICILILVCVIVYFKDKFKRLNNELLLINANYNQLKDNIYNNAVDDSSINYKSNGIVRVSTDTRAVYKLNLKGHVNFDNDENGKDPKEEFESKFKSNPNAKHNAIDYRKYPGSNNDSNANQESKHIRKQYGPSKFNVNQIVQPKVGKSDEDIAKTIVGSSFSVASDNMNQNDNENVHRDIDDDIYGRGFDGPPTTGSKSAGARINNKMLPQSFARFQRHKNKQNIIEPGNDDHHSEGVTEVSL